MARRDDVGRVAVTVSIFVIVLIGLQIFLMTLAIDALHAGQAREAWVAAGMSAVLAAGSIGFGTFLRDTRRRRPNRRTQPR
jgi:multidrug transporter EmrE-like cation transporter